VIHGVQVLERLLDRLVADIGAVEHSASGGAGAEIVERLRARRDDVDFIIGTFSKSVGTVGGFCVSNHPKFEILRLVCRPYVFTASLPPSVVATAATSIRKLMDSADKRAHLWENSKRLHAGLRQLGFTLGTDEPQSAIIAVIMPDLEKGAAMWEALLHEGLYVNLARPPATPAGMTLLRCSLCALHSEEQVGEILGMFAAAGRATGCIS
jgi:glycine C-acetyltransferase/8-amino-7-oxononanoate synthase